MNSIRQIANNQSETAGRFPIKGIRQKIQFGRRPDSHSVLSDLIL
jgi:hypothetical protein